MIPEKIKSLILDMDGVLWRADSPIGNLRMIYSQIIGSGRKVVFATNNATKTPAQYLERLEKFGIQAEIWQVVTSSLCVAQILRERYPDGGQVYYIGESGLEEALKNAGFIPVTGETVVGEKEASIKAVVMGMDREINSIKMNEAALLLRNGVPFYATNPDKTFPTPRGEIPGAGAWISVLITTTGITPEIAGKPSPIMIAIARKRLGTNKDETLVVGDRLETDIMAGQKAGCPVALVLSGVTTRSAAEKWKPKVNFIADDLESLIS